MFTYSLGLPAQQAFLPTIEAAAAMFAHDGRDGPAVFVSVQDRKLAFDLNKQQKRLPVRRSLRCAQTTHEIDKRLPLLRLHRDAVKVQGVLMVLTQIRDLLLQKNMHTA